MSHSAERFSGLSKRDEGLNDLEKAKAIVRESYRGYTRTRHILEKRSLLEPAISAVSKEYKKVFEPEYEGGARFEMTHKDWEMLAILWLYDAETAHHSVETYRIARDKVTLPLLGEIVLANEFHNEGVSLDTFFRACIFHDIGKIAIPIEVLTNPLSDTDCARLLFAFPEETLASCLAHKIQLPPKMLADASPEEFVDYLYKTYKVRPLTILPVKFLLTKDQFRVASEKLARNGLTLDSTFSEVLDIHELKSQEILESEGYDTEAQIAGSHHTDNRDTRFRITIGTLQLTIDLSDIIHLADIEQAVGSARYYKPAKSQIVVLNTLIEHVRSRGAGLRALAHVWVADEVANMSKGDLSEAMESSEASLLENILKFIHEEQKKSDKYGNLSEYLRSEV
ncbi:MAG TPA: hypothetical protein ENJ75_01170 [Candidatus Kaiserbacteria bacterium]|nr:hypothetical protein [Candidatus Kaiserbacteria bacterium]